jgi:biotin carboxyl carrier protein
MRGASRSLRYLTNEPSRRQVPIVIYDVTIAGKNHRLELSHKDGRWQGQLDGRGIEMDAMLTRPDVLSLLIEGKSHEIKRERAGNDVHLWVGPARYSAEVRDPRSLRGRQRKGAGDKGPQRLIALMPGKVVRLLVEENTEVEAGQGVLVVEAMKMQNEIRSPKKGVLAKSVVAEGDRVNAGDVLAIVD